ncbi:MAG: UDP-2,3-diacylglucosamine diphosphatase LpxI [Candidatus Omnitrophica bacterium]|nr:UDP-2,3-diacylglucosamine diphosphatase LpxI [Candidatus Omnitrophota bacterium]MBU1870046.1 UDP-2,3-diacylglucosamine diphosphatase LpxI [Candidatus Omnitrophota bacterium]
MEKIGLIAGNRKFPILFCEAAKDKGYHIVAVAIKGDTSSAINRSAGKTYWIGLNEFSKMFEIFKGERITKVVMAGQVSPHRLFSKEINKDEALRGLLENIRDKKADTIFGAVAAKLKDNGFELLDSTIFIEEHLPKKGTLTKSEPDQFLREDIDFGFGLAKAIGGLDIGQTVAVKSKAVIAVEALEGTDNLIRRAGRISRGGFTLIKASKPKQDMRFDIPVVGLNTIRNLVRAKARCLAIEADKTLFIDRQESVRLADKKGIVIVAV